jgi:DNA-directed RNA polymerase sigma subunit (sigma70/sigma32)
MREADIKNFIAKKNAPYIPNGKATTVKATLFKNKSPRQHERLPVLGKTPNGQREKIQYTPVGIDAEKIMESASLRRTLMMYGESAIAANAVNANDDVESELIHNIDAKKNILPRAVQNLIGSLTLRDQDILRFYFYENMTLSQIGKHIGLCGPRVLQLKNRACKRLRETDLAHQILFQMMPLQ